MLQQIIYVILNDIFEAQKQIVKEHCSEEAYWNVVRYGRRWNVES